LPRTQFRWIKLRQPIIESPEPGEFSVEREAAVIVDFAIVLVKTESGSVERVRGQIRFHVFLGYRFVFGVLRWRSENRAGERKRQQNYGKPERFPSSALINTGLQPEGTTRRRMKPF
jgi:hypothetical protein